MFWGFADYANNPFALDDFTIIAHFLHWRTYFHR